MTSDFGEKLATQLIRTGRASRSELIPCSEQEVQELEELNGVRLPAIYRSFLLRMGRGAGEYFLSDLHAFYPDLLGLREDAEELLEEDKADFRLPSDAFVFLDDQGYHFFYFLARDGDDPPLCHYTETEGRPRRSAVTLSEYLLACAAEPIEYYEDDAFWPRWRIRFRQLLCRVLGSRYARLGLFHSRQEDPKI